MQMEDNWTVWYLLYSNGFFGSMDIRGLHFKNWKRVKEKSKCLKCLQGNGCPFYLWKLLSLCGAAGLWLVGEKTFLYLVYASPGLPCSNGGPVTPPSLIYDWLLSTILWTDNTTSLSIKELVHRIKFNKNIIGILQMQMVLHDWGVSRNFYTPAFLWFYLDQVWFHQICHYITR